MAGGALSAGASTHDPRGRRGRPRQPVRSQHAAAGWFDQGGRDALHSDAVSDLVVQMLLNQLC